MGRRIVIALALLMLQAAPALAAIERQPLPKQGCAAYLWQVDPEPKLLAWVGERSLRVRVDGAAVTLAQTATRGESRLGLPAVADFAGGGLVATLDMTIVIERGLADGARVPQATLTLGRAGGDVAIVPLAGLAGCASTPR